MTSYSRKDLCSHLVNHHLLIHEESEDQNGEVVYPAGEPGWAVNFLLPGQFSFLFSAPS